MHVSLGIVEVFCMWPYQDSVWLPHLRISGVSLTSTFGSLAASRHAREATFSL